MAEEIIEKIQSIKFDDPCEKKEKDFWRCADPGCKTENRLGTTNCEACQLSNEFVFEKFGKMGRTRVKTLEEVEAPPAIYEEHTVIHTFLGTICVRSLKIQEDFIKFTENLAAFLKETQKKVNLKNPLDPDDEDVYILYGEDNLPYRVQFKDFYEEDLAVEKSGLWTVAYMDFGKRAVVDPKDLITLPRSPFQEMMPIMRRCYLDNVHFKNVNSSKKARIEAWMQEQLLNKTLMMSIKELQSKYRYPENGTVSYADIIMEDGLPFREKVIAELGDFIYDC